jgi:hypothetical protein
MPSNPTADLLTLSMLQAPGLASATAPDVAGNTSAAAVNEEISVALTNSFFVISLVLL